MRIIINNINVADCEFRGYCDICKLKSGSSCPMDCKDNPNCHYKQLKRKELEYNKLKQEYDEAFGAIDNVRQAKEDLQKENKDLRKEIAFGNNGTLSDKIRAEVFKDLNKENNQLKQALEEIREIVSSTLDCGEWIGQGDNKMEKICTIIKELKDE